MKLWQVNMYTVISYHENVYFVWKKSDVLHSMGIFLMDNNIFKSKKW